MHDIRLREQARARVRAGRTVAGVARDMGLPQTTVHRWATRVFASDLALPQQCFRCGEIDPDPPRAAAYAYVLGQYLGDGHLVTRARVPVLRVYTCTDYPEVLRELEAAVLAVRGAVSGRVHPRHSERMINLQSYWKHWPCVLPQHGPGLKHTRPIVLAGWQQAIVDEHPWPLIRGLIHSDGCRSMNRVVVRGKAYEYPRYLFSNESRDIHAIMGRALDRVGVEWRHNRPNSISVARRASVAIMDEHVGPKR